MLYDFYVCNHQSGRCVTVSMQCVKLREMHPDLQVTSHALSMRVHRWLTTQRIVQHCATHIAQEVKSHKHVIDDFVAYVKEKIDMHKLIGCQVANMDETNICFDMMSNTTLESCGASIVSIANCETSDCCTAVLAVKMDGSKLPPLVIFKGKPNGCIAQ